MLFSFSPLYRRSLGVAAGATLFALLKVDPLQAQTQRTLTLQQALDIAVARAPQVAARQASADGAAAAQLSAGQLPDPRLIVGLDSLPVTGSDRFNPTSDSMTVGKVGWVQEMPNSAKRKARADVAEAMTARERAVLAADRQVVKREAALAWLTRFFAERRLALFGALERENQLLQDTINVRVTASRALPADATMVRQEAAQLADRRDELNRDAAQAQAALKRWVGDAADAALAGDFQLPALDPVHLRENLSRHVELAAFEPAARVAAAEAREAEAGKHGDWAWEVTYGVRGSPFSDLVSVQVAFELPIFTSRRRDPRILAKQKEVQRIEAEREEMLREHTQAIEAALAVQDELTRKLARFRERALPLAQERVRLQMASYQAGRIDLGAVLAARRDQVETQLKGLDTEAALELLHARLSYLFTEHQP